MPRGIAYTDFPIKADPFYLGIDPEFGNRPESGTLSLTFDQIAAAMARQACFVYDESGYTGYMDVNEIVENRYTAGQVYRKIGASKPIYARLQGQDRFELTTPGALEAASAGWHRLHYSYKTNFRAIGLKALDHVLGRYPLPDFANPSLNLDPRETKSLASMQDRYRQSHISWLDDPWALQILYMFRSLKSEDEAFLAGMNMSTGYWFQQFSSSKTGGFIENGNWVGSGKYEVRFPILRPLQCTIGSAIALGLLTHRESGKIALTEAGNAFLDIMQKDNNDPDAIIRFMNPSTQTIPVTEIDRVDAWMMRFFRKMKTKVNAL